jgi:hypothetical protein
MRVLWRAEVFTSLFFAKQNATALAGAEGFTSLFCETKPTLLRQEKIFTLLSCEADPALSTLMFQP